MATTADASTASKPSTAQFWGGWVLGVLPCLMLVMSGVMKISHAAQVVEGFGKQGYPVESITFIGLAELACVVLYLVPQTAVLGAILAVGYLGGAVDSHVRLGESGKMMVPVVFGVMLWLGLYLRDARLRALVPLRSTPAK